MKMNIDDQKRLDEFFKKEIENGSIDESFAKLRNEIRNANNSETDQNN